MVVGVVRQRNYGIDLAKISAMFFMVLLHNLYVGGLLNEQIQNDLPRWIAAWSLESLAIVAVNVFAMASGYLSAHREFIKSAELLQIILQALFWSWLILIVLQFAKVQIPSDVMLKYLLPDKPFWYVNAYIGMILLSPFLNAGIKQLQKKQFLGLILVLVLISVTIGYRGHFYLEGGYSAYWLIVNYLIGAYIGIYVARTRFKKTKLLLGYLLTAAASLAWAAKVAYAGGSAMATMSYSTIFVLAQSLFFFLLLTQFTVKSNRMQKVLKFFSQSSLGVYLIDASAFYALVLPNLFIRWLNLPPVIMMLCVLGATLVMFCVTNCQLKCNFLPMKTSDGVFQPKTLRGRLFSCAI